MYFRKNDKIVVVKQIPGWFEYKPRVLGVDLKSNSSFCNPTKMLVLSFCKLTLLVLHLHTVAPLPEIIKIGKKHDKKNIKKVFK